jgi:hypothetical protein
LDPSTGYSTVLLTPSDNANNDYDPAQIGTGTGLLNKKYREPSSGFNVTVSEGQDYSKLENARKLNLMNTYNAQVIFLATKTG